MDPRETDEPWKRKNPQSRLMQAKHKSASGESVNFCPFGCADEEIDAFGYCHHLVGFTLPADKGIYEEFMPPDHLGRRNVSGKHRHKVKKGDKLERISTSYRVYRNVERPDWANEKTEELEPAQAEE